MAKELAKLKEEMRTELLKEIRQEFKFFKESLERDLRNEIRDVRTEQRQMSQSIDFSLESVEELKQNLASEISKNTSLAKENDELRTKCAALEKKASELERRLTNSEQYSRNTNLEIQGVVKKENEDLSTILSEIGKAIHEPISSSDVECCHRVQTRNPEKTNIIVQFKSRAKRDAALKKAKKTRITNRDLGLESTCPVYVNEHLCPSLKRLLGMAVKRKYEHKWKSVWSSNGKIYARENDGGDVVQISEERDLAKITSIISGTTQTTS